MSSTAEKTECATGSATRRAIVGLLVRTLRPLALLMLKQGMTAYEFNEVARWVFARTAMERRHFGIRNRDAWSITKSRSAVLTGFTRREVDRLVSMPEPATEAARENFHRLVRVLRAWQTMDGYQDEHGQPRDLPLKGRQSFDTLARQCGRDIPVRALLDEAVERGCVVCPDRQNVRFVHDVTDGPQISVAELDRLGRHAGHFMELVEKMLSNGQTGAPFFEITAGPLSREHQAALERRIVETVKEFTSRIDRQFSSHPKSLMADNANRAVFGVYHGFL